MLKDWKTNAVALASAAMGLGMVWLPSAYQQKVKDSSPIVITALMAMGFKSAKDNTQQ